MPSNKMVDQSGIEKKVGYTGGGSAATARPPQRVPSGAHRPAANGTGNGKGSSQGSSKK